MKNSFYTTIVAIILIVIMAVPVNAQENPAERADSAAIRQAAFNYIDGYYSGDVARIEKAVHPDLNKATPRDILQTGRTALAYTTWSALVEFTRAKIGALDDTARHISVSILDITDGLAVARCESTGLIEYIQMYKGNGHWKIFNSIARPNTGLTLEQAMTVIAGDPMYDFSLPVYGGGTFDLSDHRGKNIMLIFPRGWTGNNWCSYCPYQYLELEQLEKESEIMAKYDLEIAFVMPYSSERVKDWIEKFPDAMQTVENIKNPQQKPAANSIQADYSDWVKANFPIVFDVKKDDPHKIIPVLVDEERTLSRRLKIFTGFWDGVSAEQNIASVFIIDKKGILRLKYIGQMTEDRPTIEFLLDFIKKMK
jgi:peroxiredoxin